jgi:hypothetical protein
MFVLLAIDCNFMIESSAGINAYLKVKKKEKGIKNKGTKKIGKLFLTFAIPSGRLVHRCSRTYSGCSSKMRRRKRKFHSNLSNL